MEEILNVFSMIFTLKGLAFICLGVVMGLVFGCIPGLSTPIALALILPITFVLDQTSVICLIMGIYAGGISGGLVSAITLKIPGSSAAVATTFDGHPMALRGEGGRAIRIGTLYSFLGGMVSLIALFAISPILAKWALKFSYQEYFAIAVLSLLLIQFGDAIGIGTMLATRISFLLTAGWWLVFTLPMLRHVHQKHGIDPERNIVLHTLRNVKNTCGMIIKNRSVVAFIIAYFFYIDGVGTIIHMATVFGDSCGLGSMDMMLVLLVVQIVAFPFAILYGKLAEKVGSRTMILTGIATYIVVCFVAFRLSTLRDFLILAVLVGTAQGGIQALSRSFFGKLVPEESASEYFGFFDVFGKFSAVIGPALFGIVAQATGVSRYGILPVLSMFILGGVIMTFIVPKKIERIH